MEVEPGDEILSPASQGRRVGVFPTYDLRHFKATEMLNAGVPVVVVSRRLDHKRVSTTFDRYAYAVPGQDEQASATLWPVMTTA